MTEMMELAHEDFIIAIANRFKDLKDNMNLMRRKWKIYEKRTLKSSPENYNI